MTSIDAEFELFKAKLLEQFNQFAERLPNKTKAKIHAELFQLIMEDPHLRADFVRSVFANDKKLPDVQNIRSRLRGRA